MTSTAPVAANDVEVQRPAVHINTFALPEDPKVKLAHAVYNPSPESLNLKSERDRTVFPEIFITNPRLGTLGDLAARALAKEYGVNCLLPNDPLRLRLQLDSISVDMPLEEIYQIEDIKFWRRVVMSRTKNYALQFLDDDKFDWKGEGISLKYIELVEACPAEFWPEQKMRDLALKVKDFVTHLHIRLLQSLSDYAFTRYLGYVSESDMDTSTDVSLSTLEEKSESEINAEVDAEEARGSGDTSPRNSSLVTDKDMWHISSYLLKSGLLTAEEMDEDNEDARRLSEKLQKKKEARKAARRARRIEQQARRSRRESKRLTREMEPVKPKRIRVRDFYSLPVEEPEDDEAHMLDRRNPEKYLAHIKNYNYPPEHCHHIDLRFVRYFDKLVCFEIEFNPPELNSNYHTRHFNFSYDDIEHLASGISDLHSLRIFRLRNSRMDDEKLMILANALNRLEVEVLDFGYDNLKDDCEDGLFELFTKSPTINSLELEGNYLGEHSMRRLGRALMRYKGHLEYLGLARNPINDDALHALCCRIATTTQIESLCLAGIRISSVAMICCIADELLVQHKVLRELDLMSSPFSVKVADELVMAANTNQKVIRLEYRGCNLDEANEFDVEVCIRRNQYLEEHLYRDLRVSEINEYLKRVKNPILLAANERVEKRSAAMAARPDIAEPFSPRSLLQLGDSRTSALTTEAERNPEESLTSVDDSEESYGFSKVPFVYQPNEFNMEEFHEHVAIPGPGQRYHYFQARNRIHCENVD